MSGGKTVFDSHNNEGFLITILSGPVLFSFQKFFCLSDNIAEIGKIL